MSNETGCKSCVDCGVLNCAHHDREYPDFCLTTELTEEQLAEVKDLYQHDPLVHKVTVASAEVEGAFYGKMTRIEETMEFARRIGAKKLGIATCAGLIREARVIAQIFRKHGFEVYGVACKVGAIEKAEVPVEEKYIMKPHESMCNPIMQAKILNAAHTDLNVLVGLCVGHDSLFYRYAEGLTTTLIAKDRVTGHNPIAPVYLSQTYYKKLLQDPK